MGESTTKNGKVITALTSTTIRGIVNSAKRLAVQKEDIVSLVKEGNQYVLIYYEGRED